MGTGEGKKSATFWASRLRAPTLRAPTLRGPDPSGPHSFGPQLLRAPTLSGGGPPNLHFFWVWAPTFLIFSCCSFVLFVHFLLFLFLVIFFFSNFQIFTVLLVVLKKLLNYYFTFFHFSSWGEGRRQTQTPNQFPVWEGDHYSPKPQTSLGFGEEMWGYYPPLPPPKPKPTSLKPVSAAACSDRDGSK